MWAVGLVGAALLSLSILGHRASHSLAKHRLSLALAGVALVLVYVVPLVVRGFNEGILIGREIREQQGR